MTENLLRQTVNFLRETEYHRNVADNLLWQIYYRKKPENCVNDLQSIEQTSHIFRASTDDNDYILDTSYRDGTTNAFAKIVPSSECESDTDDNHAYLQADSSKFQLSECMENHRHSLLCLKRPKQLIKKIEIESLLEYR